VILYGLLADEELYTDFLVAKALDDQVDDFLLAIAEERLFATGGGSGYGECVNHFGRRGRFHQPSSLVRENVQH
jgi:hypothetical protein